MKHLSATQTASFLGRWPVPEEREEDIGTTRRCYRCGEWWPIEPGVALDGTPVCFWRPYERRCHACVMEMQMERYRRRKAA